MTPGTAHTIPAHDVTFRVLSLPAPQGSKTKMPNGAMVEAASATGRAKVKAWRTDVMVAAALIAELQGAMVGPVIVVARFRFPMPKSRPAAVRRFGLGWKVGKPDLDKLQRATGDALAAAGLLADDAAIVGWSTTKVEVADGWTGALITVRTAEFAELLADDAAIVGW